MTEFMRIITISEPGGPDVLTPERIERPDPGPGEVRIRVAAAGINGADLAQRRGNYPPPAGAPQWPGLEVSGMISATGEGVTEWSEGDRVCALLPGGGYAEFAVVDGGLVLPVPAVVDLRDAAGLPETAATVWSNVFDLGSLPDAGTLLVHGGSSGIGTMAIQLAVAYGCRVIATAGSAEKVAACEGLGAVGVNYRESDFVDAVREATDGRGVNVVLDMVGGDYLARDIECLAVGGRIMVIANQSGQPSTFSVGALMAKRGRIHGTAVRSRPLAERRAIIRGVRDEVWPLLDSRAVRPVIDSVFPLEDAPGAHRRMEADHIGKILLAVDPEVAAAG